MSSRSNGNGPGVRRTAQNATQRRRIIRGRLLSAVILAVFAVGSLFTSRATIAPGLAAMAVGNAVMFETWRRSDGPAPVAVAPTLTALVLLYLGLAEAFAGATGPESSTRFWIAFGIALAVLTAAAATSVLVFRAHRRRQSGPSSPP